MSHVEAYIADCCGVIKKASEVVGMEPIEDLFDIMLSYPTPKVDYPEKYKVHYCLECYRERVLTAAANAINRKKDEAGYILKVKELSYNLRREVVQKWIAKNHVANKKGRKF